MSTIETPKENNRNPSSQRIVTWKYPTDQYMSHGHQSSGETPARPPTYIENKSSSDVERNTIKSLAVAESPRNKESQLAGRLESASARDPVTQTVTRKRKMPVAAETISNDCDEINTLGSQYLVQVQEGSTETLAQQRIENELPEIPNETFQAATHSGMFEEIERTRHEVKIQDNAMAESFSRMSTTETTRSINKNSSSQNIVTWKYKAEMDTAEESSEESSDRLLIDLENMSPDDEPKMKKSCSLVVSPRNKQSQSAGLLKNAQGKDPAVSAVSRKRTMQVAAESISKDFKESDTLRSQYLIQTHVESAKNSAQARIENASQGVQYLMIGAEMDTVMFEEVETGRYQATTSKVSALEASQSASINPSNQTEKMPSLIINTTYENALLVKVQESVPGKDPSAQTVSQTIKLPAAAESINKHPDEIDIEHLYSKLFKPKNSAPPFRIVIDCQPDIDTLKLTVVYENKQHEAMVNANDYLEAINACVAEVVGDEQVRAVYEGQDDKAKPAEAINVPQLVVNEVQTRKVSRKGKERAIKPKPQSIVNQSTPLSKTAVADQGPGAATYETDAANKANETPTTGATDNQMFKVSRKGKERAVKHVPQNVNSQSTHLSEMAVADKEPPAAMQENDATHENGAMQAAGAMQATSAADTFFGSRPRLIADRTLTANEILTQRVANAKDFMKHENPFECIEATKTIVGNASIDSEILDSRHQLVGTSVCGSRRQMTFRIEETILSLAVLNTRIYVTLLLRANSLYVYDRFTSQQLKSVVVLGEKSDEADLQLIAACKTNQCLYVSDVRNKRVLQLKDIESNACDTSIWYKGNTDSISVTSSGRVLLIQGPNIIIYAFNRMHLCNVVIYDLGLLNHAVETSTGTFIVCTGGSAERQHRVCEISKAGDLMRAFGSDVGEEVGKLCRPSHLVLDDNDNIFVADYDNYRTLVLNYSNFAVHSVILTGRFPHGGRPRSLFYDRESAAVVCGMDQCDENEENTLGRVDTWMSGVQILKLRLADQAELVRVRNKELYAKVRKKKVNNSDRPVLGSVPEEP